MIGHVVGNYRILGELGRGGMGMVYRAEHVQLGRPAAVKMLLPQLSADTAIVQRFFNEARAASAIDHPGIVEIYDFGQHTDGSAYIVMALLKGESLEQRMRRGPLAANESATIIAQTASALAAAHALGIVHRDLKPDNIFLVPNEMMPFGIQPKLLDFGIAKLAGDGSPEHRTQTGMMMGTPAYMSPEQCMGKSDLDHRTDLYSLGCILFHLLGGRPPFTSEHGTGMIIAAHLRDQPPDLRTLNASVPEPLVAIVRCLLEKEPAARFQSALALRDALVHAGADAPRTKPPQLMPDQFGATILPTATGPSTTRGGSAAQIVPAAATAVTGPKAKTGLAVGLALAAAGAAIAAAVVTQGGDRAPSVAAGSGSAAVIADAPIAIDAAVAVATAPCPAGQSRRDDTHGQCCYAGQAYSLANSRCVGTPMCPPGQVAQAETCAPPAPATILAEAPMGPASPPAPAEPTVPASPPPPTQRPPDRIAAPKPGTTVAPGLALSARTAKPGETITVSFSKPIASPNDRRAWITIVDAKAPASAYGAWAFVDDGATTMTFKVPTTAGAYEVRLHVNYPQQAHDLRRRARLTIADAGAALHAVTSPQQQRFVAPTTAKPGATIDLHFPRPMRAAPGEKFWVTVVEASAPDASYGAWQYVADAAKQASLVMPDTAGDYELRLHANYPKRSTNVVFRTRIHVDP